MTNRKQRLSSEYVGVVLKMGFSNQKETNNNEKRVMFFFGLVHILSTPGWVCWMCFGGSLELGDVLWPRREGHGQPSRKRRPLSLLWGPHRM